MPILIPFSVFVFFVLASIALYWLLSRPVSEASERLETMRRQGGDTSAIPVIKKSTISALAERIAEPINRMAPPSAEAVGKLQKKLMHAGYRSPKARRPRVVVEPIEVEPHPLLTWALQVASGLVREDRRTRLSDELYPDVVGEIVLARLERQDPVARASAWLRCERSWRHHGAPLLEAA